MPLPFFPFKFSSSSSRRIIFTATGNTVIFISTSNSIYAVRETCSHFYSTFGWSDQTSEWKINVGQTPYTEIVTYIPAIIPICYRWWQSCWSTYLNLPHPTRGVAANQRRRVSDDGDGDYGENDNADEEAKTSKYPQNRSLSFADSCFL